MELNKKESGILSDPKLKKLLVTILLGLVTYFGGEKVYTAVVPVSESESPKEFSLPPKAVVSGPTAGRPGSLLILDATESKGDHFAWSVTPELPDGETTIYPIEKNRKCLLTSIPGTYTVTLGVGNAEGIDMVKWTVIVRSKPGPSPDPKPDPPNPEPDPPKPEPEPEFDSEIAEQAYEHFKKVDAKPGELSGLISTIKVTVAKGSSLNWTKEEIFEEFKSGAKAVFSGSSNAKERWEEYDKWQISVIKNNSSDSKNLLETLQQISKGLEAAQ